MTPHPKPEPRVKAPRPLRRKAPMRSETPMERTAKKPRRIVRLPADVRDEVLTRSHGRCERRWPAHARASWRCGLPVTQVAHVHGLGMGGNRSKRNATCSTCGTRLNDPANLLAVCSLACNDAVARPCPGKTPAPAVTTCTPCAEGLHEACAKSWLLAESIEPDSPTAAVACACSHGGAP